VAETRSRRALVRSLRVRYTGAVNVSLRDAAWREPTSVLRVAFLALVLVSWASVAVGALTVSVAEFRLVAGAGDKIAAAFVVVNDQPRAVALSLSVTDWDDDPGGVTHLFPVRTVERSCGSWLELEELSFLLGPSEERTLNFVLRVPLDTKGTHWAGLLIREASPFASVASESLVRVFVTVPPAESSAAVTDVSVISLVPFRVSARLANTGDVRVCGVQGLVSVEGPEGHVASLLLSPFNLLPGHAIEVGGEAEWGLDSSGTYVVRVVFDYGAEALVAGQVVVRIP
jgi:hypothetical protein